MIKSRVLISALICIFGGINFASAAFHSWSTSEIYSNASGTIQFVEYFTMNSGENFAQSTNGVIKSNSNTFAFDHDLDTGLSTAGRHFLVGTSSYDSLASANANVPSPDFVVPDNFFDADGDTVRLLWSTTSPIDTEVLAAGDVPTDNINSLQIAAPGNTRSTGINSPTNFDGQTGSVPEPSCLVLCAVGLGFLKRRIRR